MSETAKQTSPAYLYFEDLLIGQKFNAGPISATQEEIIAFAKQYDPQDFHTDPVKAKDTIFGGLVASGWHTSALTMRMLVDAVPNMKGGMIGRAVEKISWPRPVRAGDVLTLEVEVLDLRTSDKSPDRGWMRTRSIVFNQEHKPVMEMEAMIFVPRRVG
jgi:acyl dehydratase